jgi:uncharacterized protein YcaQ
MPSGARPSFSLSAVAALFLARQHLDRPRSRKLSAKSLVRFAGDVAGIQLDSINVVERAHYLTLWSRFGPYDRAALDRLVYTRRLLFEYWAHAACLVPTEHFPAWRRAMLEYSTRSRAWGSWLDKHRALTAEVEAAIAARGPLGNADFAGDEGRKSGGFWNWKPATHALDYLWMSGRTLIHSRAHFHKRFDLAERVLPEALALEPLGTEAFRRWHLERSLHALGAATLADLRMYLTFPRAPSMDRRRVLGELVAEGQGVELAVETAPGEKAVPWYALRRDLPALRAAAAEPAHARGATILTPFDSFLWYRERTARLFGFNYRIEVYTPGHQRVHGYYVLPIFHDGQLIGRVDAKNHRAEGRLELKRVHFEPWFARGLGPPRARFGKLDRDDAFAGIAEAARSLAEFLGAERLSLGKVEPARVGAALKRAFT